MTMTYESRMLIDGKLTEASGGATYDNINPATEAVIGPVADANEADMERAITAARRAFDETKWSTDKAFRKACLLQLKDALDKHKEDLRPQIVAEVGAPIGLTYAIQQDSCIDDMQWDIDLIDRYEFEYELGAHEFFGMSSNRLVVREPIGVVGAITPWNFPFMLNLSKLAPALAAGCTVILKPAPDTPYSATWIGKLAAEETDIPAGVFNVVTSGHPAPVGDVLTGDPRVDMISFTGSTAVGKHIAARGSGSLKRVFLELGGKSANVVLDDADFPSTLAGAGMVCMHSGQGCAITTRLLLPRSRYDEGVDIVRQAFESFPYGDPTDISNMAGPLINARQRERVLGYIEKGKAEGARRSSAAAPRHAVRQGLLRAADPLRRRRPELHDRAGGDLRAGAVGHPLRGRRRRGAHRQQLALRPVGLGLQRLARPRARCRPPHPDRHGRRERRPVVRPRLALRRLQGERPRPRARRRRLRGIPGDQDHRPPRLTIPAAGLVRRVGIGRRRWCR